MLAVWEATDLKQVTGDMSTACMAGDTNLTLPKRVGPPEHFQNFLQEKTQNASCLFPVYND